MKTENSEKEEFEVTGENVLAKVKEIIKTGTASRIIIKNEKGEEVLNIPLAVGAIGVIFAPILAAVGALGALVAKFTIVVERRK